MMNGYIMARFLSFLSIIVIGLFIFGSAAQSAQLSDSGSGVQMTGDAGSGNVATPASQEQGQVSDQAQQQPQQAADLQEDEITYFDPSTIPDSPPIPDADWVFAVPIDVSNLPSAVNQLGVVCEVFRFANNRNSDKYIYGKAKRKLDLIDGSYQGSVLIGANRSGGNNNVAHNVIDLEYECFMYLIGPENHWVYPSTNLNTMPYWQRADPTRPFRWKTDRHPVPK